jgi:hypothetical protein
MLGCLEFPGLMPLMPLWLILRLPNVQVKVLRSSWCRKFASVSCLSGAGGVDGRDFCFFGVLLPLLVDRQVSVLASRLVGFASAAVVPSSSVVEGDRSSLLDEDEETLFLSILLHRFLNGILRASGTMQ